MVTDERTREKAKEELRKTLVAHAGNTKHEEVVAAIQALSHLNPAEAPAYENPLLDGNWLLISAPNFPGKLQSGDGRCIYTLGRLAFNMFQPTDLEVAIHKVRQPVLPVGRGEQRTHDIVVEFSTISEQLPRIEGIVRNTGLCQPKDKTHLQVWFTGGLLIPKKQTDLEAWKTLFGSQTKQVNHSFKERIERVLLRLMFGIVPPRGFDPETEQISFEMKRSPKGNLELIYLDEELRITKGEKGTILICEREPS